ncbi:MAG: hypothetical protein O7C60_00555, partial [Rickettsia endosymbiont of Ixodes persulcatus]|nr:hypothetical protein [Rickettsia endosymbiont of Ixodes persulcatus]
EHIMIIYRARWQIELLFKLYKSHAKIENLKGRSKSARVLCELYGKLFRNTMTLDCNILQQFNSVKLLDSSDVILPANMADMYKGCGACYKGRSSTVQSSLKLQVVFPP